MEIVDRLTKAGTRVAVLCGGPGGEREVSLHSGERVHEALEGAGLANEMLIVPERSPEAFLEQIQCDLAIIMLHGRFGEDGGAQTILERRGIVYSGSGPAACALSMDKNASKELFVKNGIPTQPWILSNNPAAAATEAERAGMRYPFFVKPNRGGSSVCTSKVMEAGELPKAVAATLEDDSQAMIEEMVVGRELTVGWLAGRVLPPIELAAEGVFYDYHAKYVSEQTKYVCPADLSPGVDAEIRKYAADVAELLGVRDLSRVDVMLGEAGPRVLELNAIPGFTAHSLLPMAAAAVGMKFEQLCLELATMAAGRAGIV